MDDDSLIDSWIDLTIGYHFTEFLLDGTLNIICKPLRKNMLPPRMAQFTHLIGHKDMDITKWLMDSNIKK